MLHFVLHIIHRFGVLFVSDGSPDDDGSSNAGVALVRAFSFIKAEKTTKEAFDFVTEVQIYAQILCS